jgi:hypothetical protein
MESCSRGVEMQIVVQNFNLIHLYQSTIHNKSALHHNKMTSPIWISTNFQLIPQTSNQPFGDGKEATVAVSARVIHCNFLQRFEFHLGSFGSMFWC